MEITGNSGSDFAEFEIENLGHCDGFSIKFTNQNIAGISGQGAGTSASGSLQSDACDLCSPVNHTTVPCDDLNNCTALDSMTISITDGSVCLPCAGVFIKKLFETTSYLIIMRYICISSLPNPNHSKKIIL